MSKALRQIVYDHLCDQLINGDLQSGSRVCELTLAKETGVSRSPVREALGQLRAEGILEQVPGYGAFVKSPTRQDLIEAFQVREWLEAEVVYALAERNQGNALERELDELIATHEQMLHILRTRFAPERGGMTSDDIDAVLRLDMAFHAALLTAAKNLKVAKIIGDTRLLIHASGCAPEPDDAEYVSEVFSAHDLILRAVRSGDPEQARTRMAEHVRWAKDRAIEIFDTKQSKAQPERPATANPKRLAGNS